MLKTRIIPCLDVADGRVVKGVNFVDLRDAGDPVEAARAYDAAGADELCFLDIHATHENRGTMYDLVTRTAEQCFMPLTVGGGVRTPGGCARAAARRGRQGQLQLRRRGRPRRGGRGGRPLRQRNASSWRSTPRRSPGRWEIFTHGGRKATGIDAVDFAARWPRRARARSCSPRWTATARRPASTSRSPAPSPTRCRSP
jgi:imidazole glycerol-phosphate synthase subunit HisF